MLLSKKLIVITVAMLVFGGLASFWYWNAYLRVRPMIIKIGALLPSRTGDLAQNRQQMINGMELAREYIQNKYNNEIKIVYYFEEGCFAQEAVPAVQKFIQNDVSIIGASFCLFGHLPILPMTEAYGIITFNTAANPDKTLNLHYAFSTNVAVRDEAVVLSQFAYEQLGARRVVMMYLDTPFGYDYYKYFMRDFSVRGGQVLAGFPNAPDGKDFTSIIEQIKKLKPDVIVTAHFGVPLAKFIHDLRQNGITTTILGNYETQDKTIIDYAGEASEGVIFSSSERLDDTPLMKRFRSLYIRKYSVEPTVLASNTYDTVVLTVEAYIECKGNRECIAEALHKVHDFDGASGIISISPNGSTVKPFMFKMIKNRTFIPYSK